MHTHPQHTQLHALPTPTPSPQAGNPPFREGCSHINTSTQGMSTPHTLSADLRPHTPPSQAGNVHAHTHIHPSVHYPLSHTYTHTPTHTPPFPGQWYTHSPIPPLLSPSPAWAGLRHTTPAQGCSSSPTDNLTDPHQPWLLACWAPVEG